MRTRGTVDDWFDEQEAWTAEVAELRAIVLAAGLTETLKWRQPCYTDGDDNVVMIGTLKDCCAVSFLRGALLDDPAGHLIQPGENSRSVRYMRFTSLDDVHALRADLAAMLERAIEAARAGLRVAPIEGELELVDVIRDRVASDPAFREAFEGLTPGRQRAYNIIVGGAKSASAREARITKFTERILMGKGPNDCVCGHTQKPPGCDGSHKRYA